MSTSTTSRTATESATATPDLLSEQYGDRFADIVNLVDAGADNGANELINDVLRETIRDDTLLYFPSGRYRLDPLNVSNIRNVGLVSLPRDDVQIVPATPADSMDEFVNLHDFSNVILEGIDFDFRERGYGEMVRLVAEGDFLARDLRILGRLPDQNLQDNHVGFRFDVVDPGSTGVVERIIARGGGHDGGNSVGIFVGKDHAGTLRFEDCQVANFPNNGLYASAPGRDSPGYRGENGVIHVRGGRYENNNVANVRIGSTGSTIRDVVVVVDEVPPSPEDAGLNVRGIRLRAREDQLVENCQIRIGPDAGSGFGAISYHPDHGMSTIRNTDIVVDRDDYNAIDATDASSGGTRAPLTFENVTITGSASGGVGVEIADRDGTTFRNCTIEQTGADRDGILLRNSEDCRLVESTVRVTGRPLQTVNSTVQRVGTTTEQLPPGRQTGSR